VHHCFGFYHHKYTKPQNSILVLLQLRKVVDLQMFCDGVSTMMSKLLLQNYCIDHSLENIGRQDLSESNYQLKHQVHLKRVFQTIVLYSSPLKELFQASHL